jgi:hypothetical protein
MDGLYRRDSDGSTKYWQDRGKITMSKLLRVLTGFLKNGESIEVQSIAFSPAAIEPIPHGSVLKSTLSTLGGAAEPNSG